MRKYIIIVALGVFLSAALHAETAEAYTSVTANPTQCAAPCTVTFTANMEGATGPVQSDWDLTSQDPPNFRPEVYNTPTAQKTYTMAGTFWAQVRATSNGQIQYNGAMVTIVDPGDAPAPIQFLGPTSFTTPVTLRFASPKTHLEASLSQGNTFVGPNTGVPRGQDGNGNTLYDVTFPATPTGQLNVEASAWTNNRNNADWLRGPTVTATGSTLPVLFGFSRPKLVQGWTMRRGRRVYKASGLMTGFATVAHSCAGSLRLERQVKARVRGRLVLRWVLARSVPVRCGGFRSFNKQRYETTLINTSEPYLRILRTSRLRLVYRFAIRAGRLTFSTRSLTQYVTRYTIARAYRAS